MDTTYILTIISISLTFLGMVIAYTKGNAEQFSKLGTNLASIKEVVVEIKNDLKSIRNEIQAVREDVRALDNRITKAEGRIEHLEKVTK